MAALSRNTASVAQDFHNAGGDKQINMNSITRNVNLYRLVENFNFHQYKNSSLRNMIRNENISPPAY